MKHKRVFNMKKTIFFILILVSCTIFLCNCQSLLIERYNYIYDFSFKTKENYDNIFISIGYCVAVGTNRTSNITLSQIELIDNCKCKYSVIPSINTVIIYDILYFILEKDNKTTMGAKMFSITEDISKKKYNSYVYMDFLGDIFIN